MNTPNALPQLLTAKEVAKALKLSLVQIRLLTRQGRIACVRIGRAVRYTPEHVKAFIDAHTALPA